MLKFLNKGISTSVAIAIITILATVFTVTVIIYQSQFVSEEIFGKETKIFIEEITTDKEIYYSSEVVNINVKIRSNSNLKNVLVKTEGISNKLNGEKVLDIKKGLNDVSFSYKLPRCNVCGGIREGNYILGCTAIYKDVVAENSTKISIQQ